MLEHQVMQPFPKTDDPLVQALQRLLQKEGGHVAVGDAAEINDQSLYQIAYCKPDSKTGRAKGVGPSIRARLTKRYPGWLALDHRSVSFEDILRASRAPTDDTEEDRIANEAESDGQLTDEELARQEALEAEHYSKHGYQEPSDEELARNEAGGRGFGGNHRSVAGVAHNKILDVFTVPPTISPEELMNLLTADLASTFSLLMPDDALGEAPSRGVLLVMSRVAPGEQITPNRVVPVADREGRGLVRRYGEAEDGAWQALSEHKAYRSLHSVKDGLTLIAKLENVVLGGASY